ncbi:MAG: VOC family protein [Bacteroidia bacterium]|nr:VOC family protein [Bacteroidia bacterium]
MTKIEFILYVADQQKSRNFYKQALQSDPVLDVPGMTEFQLSGDCKLGLMPEKSIAKILQDKTPHPSAGNGIPRCELYLYVDAVESCFTRAIDAGAKAVSEPLPRDWGDCVAYVSDPDGHIVAFAKKNYKFFDYEVKNPPS